MNHGIANLHPLGPEQPLPQRRRRQVSNHFSIPQPGQRRGIAGLLNLAHQGLGDHLDTQGQTFSNQFKPGICDDPRRRHQIGLETQSRQCPGVDISN